MILLRLRYRRYCLDVLFTIIILVVKRVREVIGLSLLLFKVAEESRAVGESKFTQIRDVIRDINTTKIHSNSRC
jgi:hypothetical protein